MNTDTDVIDDILLEDDLGEIMYLLQEDNVITDNNDLKAQNKTFADEAENDFTSGPDIFDFTEVPIHSSTLKNRYINRIRRLKYVNR